MLTCTNLNVGIFEQKIMARLLVVEDEENLRLALVDLLLDAGYEVQAGKNGVDALQILEQDTNFAVILSDMKMPEMDGVTLLRHVSQRYPEIAFIMITSHADVKTAVQAMRDGALNYLLKPVSNDLVLQNVREGLHYNAEQLKQPVNSVETSDQRFLHIGELVIDRYQLEAMFQGEALDLTPTEYEILYQLALAQGHIMTFEEIVYATQEMRVERAEARVMLSTHLSNLRAKLNKAGCGHYLVNKRGTGYFLSANEVNQR